MGGFECADHINRSGDRINLMKETQHDLRVGEDYKLLHDIGIKVVREGVCWTEAEIAPYIFNFNYLIPFFESAKKNGIQIIWDLCHFGYPTGLIPTHPQFISRFTAFCEAFAQFHAKHTTERLMVVPINEISFLSWHSGDVRGTVPFAVNSGDDIKLHLCKAAINGIKMLKNTTPDCIVFAVEPLIKIHAADNSIEKDELLQLNLNQFTAMDILMGKQYPELGGSIDLIDMLGFNYYYNNQWNHNNETLPWREKDVHHTPLSQLIEEAYKRYHKPIVLTETGHFGIGRDFWIEEITHECIKARNMGVDLRGICIYPVIDRPDWDDLNSYCKSGIWDLDENKERIPDLDYLDSCVKCIDLMNIELNSNFVKDLSGLNGMNF